MKTKRIGKLTIVADEPMIDRGYTTPDGKVLSKDELWKDEVFYEQDYFNIRALKNLHVRNEQDQVITPIIKELDVINAGYVCTWSQVFWVQGYVIIKDKIYFAGVGDDSLYFTKKARWYILAKSVKPGVLVDFGEFMERMVEPCDVPKYDESSTLDDLPNPSGWTDFMLIG